ncbi:MAG: SctD/MshK family protein [Beijerinckiaceae bacterium]
MVKQHASALAGFNEIFSVPVGIRVPGRAAKILRELPAGSHSFGGSLTSDVVVAGLPPVEAFMLKVAADLQSFELMALVPGILVNGQVLGPDSSSDKLHNAHVQLGDFVFEVGRSTDAGGGQPRGVRDLRSRRRAAVADVALRTKTLKPSLSKGLTSDRRRLAVASIAFAIAGFFGVYGAATRLSHPEKELAAAGASPVQASAPNHRAPAEVSANLERQLRAADLLPSIKISKNAASVFISGTVNAQENLRLREVLASVNSQMQGGSPIENRVVFASAEAEPMIGGIVFGEKRYVIARTGERIAEGEVLPSGWRVDLIRRSEVDLARDGIKQTFSLPLNSIRR